MTGQRKCAGRFQKLPPDEKRAHQKLSARKYIQSEKGKLRRKLRRGGLTGPQLDAAMATALCAPTAAEDAA